MSHVAVVKVIIKSLECLRRAGERLGLQLNLGQGTFKWFGQWMNDYDAQNAAYRSGIKTEDYGKCLHALVIPGDDEAYEIGVCANPKGEGFVLAYDFYGPGQKLLARAGPDCQILVQEYAAQVAEMEAQELLAQGFQVQRQALPNGDLQLILTN